MVWTGSLNGFILPPPTSLDKGRRDRELTGCVVATDRRSWVILTCDRS